MNDRKTPTVYVGLDRRRAPPDPGTPGTKTGETDVEVSTVSKTGGRHSAITDSLTNYHSYKTWLERMKRDFDKNK